MALTLKEGAVTGDLPTIKLAGASYFVAPLLFRQTVANMPLMPKALALARKFEQLGDAVKNDTAVPEFSAADFDPLVDLVVNGLVRLYPGATRDDLLDSNLKPIELLQALPVVIAQSGGKKPDADAGE
jgi:hypothetical protein